MQIFPNILTEVRENFDIRKEFLFCHSLLITLVTNGIIEGFIIIIGTFFFFFYS